MPKIDSEIGFSKGLLIKSPLQVDRVYLGSSHMVAVIDHEKKRTFVIRKEGLPDVGEICL